MHSKLTLTQHKVNSATGDIWHDCAISRSGAILGWQDCCHVCCLVELRHVCSTKPSLTELTWWTSVSGAVCKTTAAYKSHFLLLVQMYIYQRYSTVFQTLHSGYCMSNELGQCNLKGSVRCTQYVWYGYVCLRKQRIQSFKSYKPFKSIMILISHCYNISKHLQVKRFKRRWCTDGMTRTK